ncbi:hypothetical protein [Paenibacillus sp. GCM10027629]|uniref:hypothetical protein n=1 Tax=Paenibacillus sp. GCM10027629 TaxID=3273414 RepID=UPI0036D2456E
MYYIFGRREYKIDVGPENLLNFYKKWDCADSDTIRKWYKKNNTDYRNELAKVKKRELVSYYELILSNFPLEEIKAYLNENDPVIDNIPKGDSVVRKRSEKKDI